MKRKILAGALCLCLLLSGCSAMLERSYTSSNPHADRPVTAEDPSVLRVENYRELISAVLYLISEGVETGVIQLHDYEGDVETDLPAACLEVATQDPLGAYCVDYIKHECARVVSYYQATLDIHYRRTQEQVRSMVRVTGTGAIRTELRQALTGFAPEVVLRVAYFAGDEQSIEELIRQTYYETPAAALGYPETRISLYPDSGRERVVEILLTYPESVEELVQKRDALTEKGRALTAPEGEGPTPSQEPSEERARQVLDALWGEAVYAPDGGSTAYDALITGIADGEGMALGYALLAQQRGMDCQVIEGQRGEEPHYWVELTLDGEVLFLDPAEGMGRLFTARELFDQGYRWPEGPQEEQAEGPLGGQERVGSEGEENPGESQ